MCEPWLKSLTGDVFLLGSWRFFFCAGYEDKCTRSFPQKSLLMFSWMNFLYSWRTCPSTDFLQFSFSRWVVRGSCNAFWSCLTFWLLWSEHIWYCTHSGCSRNGSLIQCPPQILPSRLCCQMVYPFLERETWIPLGMWATKNLEDHSYQLGSRAFLLFLISLHHGMWDGTICQWLFNPVLQLAHRRKFCSEVVFCEIMGLQ